MNMEKINKFEYLGMDMHLHTIYSDGKSTVEEVVKKAYENGLEQIAICDHDSTRGVMEAIEIARKISPKLKVNKGSAELTCKYHILGYDMNIYNERLKKLLNDNSNEIKNRTKKSCEKLKDYGFEIDFEELEKMNPLCKRLSKPHISEYMINNKKICEKIKKEYGEKYVDFFEIIHNFLVKDKIGYIQSNHKDPKEIIQTIIGAGGKAYIAHPFKEVKDFKELYILQSYGLFGIEIQPTYGAKNDRFIEYAIKHEMGLIQGSDYHGEKYPTRPMLKNDLVKKVSSYVLR